MKIIKSSLVAGLKRLKIVIRKKIIQSHKRHHKSCLKRLKNLIHRQGQIMTMVNLNVNHAVREVITQVQRIEGSFGVLFSFFQFGVLLVDWEKRIRGSVVASKMILAGTVTEPVSQKCRSSITDGASGSAHHVADIVGKFLYNISRLAGADFWVSEDLIVDDDVMGRASRSLERRLGL